ncbi:MAG: Gfo/Idh/MocA family protein [Anaerorhabdus sp.]
MITWGILGAGKIAHRFAESLSKVSDSKLVAVAARKEEKAIAFQTRYKAEKYYVDYEDLIHDDGIDAIYLALPHQLHKEWAIKAMEMGKAVLCEKPAVLSPLEMKEIIETAQSSNVLFMEALKSRFVPLHHELMELIASGVIGEVSHIETSMCIQLPTDEMGSTYHTQPHYGGALLDGGIYSASLIELFLSGEIQLDKLEFDVRDDVDYYIDAYLSDGVVSARLEAAFDRSKPRNAVITGDKGSIEVIDFHRAQKMIVRVGSEEKEIVHPYLVDDFYGQLTHFSNLIKSGAKQSDVMSLHHSLRCISIIECIKKGYKKA